MQSLKGIVGLLSWILYENIYKLCIRYSYCFGSLDLYFYFISVNIYIYIYISLGVDSRIG